MEQDIDVIEIINKYGVLKKGFNHLIKNSTSNNLSYHNLNHILTVVKYCYLIMRYDNKYSDYQFECVLLAALFHDANHSGGKLSDAENVQIAKEFAREFYKDYYMHGGKKEIDEIIDATQYPYIIEYDKLNNLQKIIRDADLMQIYEPDWVYQYAYGLSQEMNTDLKDIPAKAKTFFSTIKFQTEFGKKMQREKWGHVMQKLEILESITVV